MDRIGGGVGVGARRQRAGRSGVAQDHDDDAAQRLWPRILRPAANGMLGTLRTHRAIECGQMRLLAH
ncbi:hypothetical protein, partial [Mycobacterium scrofulaceum]|uniref:hypothetical protein n=1 Tax=Mycobacterium scrofulaceum TaxID=1783 RepID=UPI001E52D4D2